MNDLDSLAFPRQLGYYENFEHQIHYYDLIDTFVKKYYLKHRQIVRIVDYLDHEINLSCEQTDVKYDDPIAILRTFDPDVQNLESKSLKIIEHLTDISQLVYVQPASASALASACGSSFTTNRTSNPTNRTNRTSKRAPNQPNT